MLSENHNNFHWKNKLEDADSLPGETLPDKNAAWEKLHARIHEKPRRKGFVWYWLAAACLLAAITIPVVLVNKKQGNLVKATLDKIEPKKETVPEIAVPKENEIVKTLPVVTEKKAAVKTTIQTKKVKPAANNIIQKPEAMATGLNEEKAIKQPAVLPAGTVDTTTSVTLATVIEKKKIKVVHVNELGDPVEVSTDVARNADLHAFQLKLASQEVYKNPSVASNKKAFTVSKQKTSPN